MQVRGCSCRLPEHSIGVCSVSMPPAGCCCHSLPSIEAAAAATCVTMPSATSHCPAEAICARVAADHLSTNGCKHAAAYL